LVVCGRRLQSEPDLANQATRSRLENAVARHACARLARALLEVYLWARERDGRPPHIVLDIDSTDDPTHGAQEGSAYHGYYGQHIAGTDVGPIRSVSARSWVVISIHPHQHKPADAAVRVVPRADHALVALQHCRLYAHAALGRADGQLELVLRRDVARVRRVMVPPRRDETAHMALAQG